MPGFSGSSSADTEKLEQCHSNVTPFLQFILPLLISTSFFSNPVLQFQHCRNVKKKKENSMHLQILPFFCPLLVTRPCLVYRVSADLKKERCTAFSGQLFLFGVWIRGDERCLLVLFTWEDACFYLGGSHKDKGD